MAAYRKKSTDDPREQSTTEDPEEEPFIDDSKRTILIRTLKMTLSLRNLKRTLSMRTLRSFKTLNDFPFCFLVVVYDREDDGDKFSYENFGLGRSRFHTTSNLKLKLNNFSRKR